MAAIHDTISGSMPCRSGLHTPTFSCLIAPAAAEAKPVFQTAGKRCVVGLGAQSGAGHCPTVKWRLKKRPSMAFRFF